MAAVARARTGALMIRDSWEHAQVMFADVNFITTLIDFAQNCKDALTDEVVDLVEPYLEMPGFDYKAVAKASRSVAQLYRWVDSMVTYHNQSKIVRPKLDALHLHEARLARAEVEVGRAEAELASNEAALEAEKAEYEAAVAKRYELERVRETTQARMLRAAAMIESLRDEKERWSADLETLDRDRATLVGDCALGSSFAAYAGQFDAPTRRFIEVCRMSFFFS